METASMMRVNAHPGSYGGHASSQQDRQQQRRQKILALFDAVEHGHFDAAKQALTVLMNFDHTFTSDAYFARLSKAIDTGSVYLAQQIVRDIKAKFVNASPLVAHAAHVLHPLKPHTPDGMHFVDTQA